PYQFVLRYSGDAAPILVAIRRITSGFDPMQTEVTVGLMQDQVDKIVAPRRLESVVINVFAGLALVLAAVGLYGVMAYQVAQRTQELGIRMALGADRARVLWFVLRDGMDLALLGAALGVALSLALSRFIAGMLFGVSARDPFTFAVVPLILVVVALAACYLPARRATKVDPMVALRYE
ncbi:MAG: FtsX-like permease family protein, partial [Gemmatimonadaceae bacterium]